MKKQLALLAAALVTVLVLSAQLARATAGPEPGDIQDSLPAWASDGVHLAFERTSPTLGHVLQTTSAGKDLFVDSFSGELRGWIPGTQKKLVQTGSETLVTEGGRFAGPPGVLHGVDASAAPDGARVAYVRAGTLYVAAPDGSGEQAVATGIAPPAPDVLGPVWSPDGSRIAIASGASLLVVGPDVRSIGSGVNPSWSPDGRTIAFERDVDSHWQIWLANADGTDAHELLGGSGANYRFPQFSPVSGRLAFISDRQHVRGGATPYQYALYVDERRKLVDDVHPYSPPRWSPTGALIAVSAGQECRRWGIYVGRSDVGARFTRRTNVCRFTGTSGADRIGGSSYFDLIRGLGGDDVILGRDGNDRIEGDDGNDRIAAGAGNDVVFGGPGDDHLYGGPGNDILVGGPGRDVIDCGAGDDTVQAVSRLDVVARSCEHVIH